MASPFTLPPVGFGPGANPFHDENLSYTVMPQGMRTYTTHLPDAPAADTGAARAVLRRAAEACDRAAEGGGALFDLAGLDAANRAFLADALGEGEVAVRILGIPAVAAQETVFAGVWSLAGSGIDRLEVAPLPQLARDRAFRPQRPALRGEAPWTAGVVNGPSILTELADASAQRTEGAAPHVVNLTLLPHTPQDLVWLDAALGLGSVTILSRGYGNCRITATALPQVWRVQFFNSMDTLILDTFEVTQVPEAAVAAAEDFGDSARRIRDVLELLA